MKLTQFPTHFPHWLREPITDILKNNPQFADPIKSSGLCVVATDALLFHLDKIYEGHLNGYMTGQLQPCHHWAYVSGWNIDLTARQFDEHADCPKIWRATAMEVRIMGTFFMHENKLDEDAIRAHSQNHPLQLWASLECNIISVHRSKK